MMSSPDATDLDSLSRNENIVACYRPPAGTIDHDLAHEAYKKAVEYFMKEFAGNEDVVGFLVGHTSIVDVENTVEKAKREYEAKGQKRRTVLKWLNKLSLGIRYYSQALDMLAQHHPEYVALAWGAIKFVLMGVINHEELIEELAKALTLIGNVLPGIKLSARLYQTEQMKGAIATLYAHVIHFFQRAARWYNKSSAGRAWSSILKPFELDYQDTVDQIKLCSETINNIAHGASRAEIRDMHITVQLIHGNLQGMQKKLHQMQLQLDEKELRMASHIGQVLQVAIANKTINEAVQLDVTDMKPRIYDLQFSNILKMLSPEVSPENILRKHTSLCRRNHQISTGYLRTGADIAKSLNLWVSTTGSSLFILRSGPRASSITRDHAVDIIKYLRNAQYKVFWILSPPSPCNSEPSVASILQSLVYQVIRHEPNILLRFPENLSTLQFLSNRSESEWLDLLCLLVSRLDKCFLIVETENLYQASRQMPEWTQEFLQVFQRLINRVETAGSLVKVLVVTFGNDSSWLSSQQGSIHNFVATIQQPRIVPPRLRRGYSRSKLRRYSQQSSQSRS
ncbi:hypothetical protein BKA65DRAFT_446146 [Rhexocercosporidium sp. MPI-PUGE-AT-0058]|nr:hypothetical protein BKA65DRAFT_446146 [Rhexocercosporidium sp. MPI-PUGE-AT-0058]